MKLKFAVFISFVLFLAACGNNTNVKEDQPLKIYTTVFPLTSFVEEIGGDTVDVESVYPAGADMHSYEPTQKDMIDYSDGDLFMTTTDELDPIAATITKTIEDDTTVISTASGITEDDLISSSHEGHDHEHDEDSDHDHEHGENDPHIWLDPNLALKMAESIRDSLIEARPEHKDLYDSNFNSLKEDLTNIDQKLTEITEQPVYDHVYISHESIGYLANRYGFHQVAINGLSNQEPSQKELTEIIDNIKQENIPYILYEPNVTSTVTDVIKDETKTEPIYFNNLETLSPKDPEDVTYQSMMDKNIETLDQALNDK